MTQGLIGQICTPAAGNRVLGVPWCADNGVYGNTYPGDEKYLRWIASRPHRDKCRFAVAPDVVADHEATLHRSLPMLPKIRELVPVAFVAQNGSTPSWVPWPDFDVLFIGGDDRFKLGPEGRVMVGAARRNGKWIHMGRVNSHRRYRYAERIGCDSVDGTYLAKAPHKLLPRVLFWTRPALFDLEVA